MCTLTRIFVALLRRFEKFGEGRDNDSSNHVIEWMKEWTMNDGIAAKR
jgi:hypothetical protein